MNRYDRQFRHETPVSGESGGLRDRNADERTLVDAVGRRQGQIDRLAVALARLEEEGVFRYYEQNDRIYALQDAVRHSRALLVELAPAGRELNEWFLGICADACARVYDSRTSDDNWHKVTRRVLEGFWHCAYFIRMLARYGRAPELASGPTPYGWAAVLDLYGLR